MVCSAANGYRQGTFAGGYFRWRRRAEAASWENVELCEMTTTRRRRGSRGKPADWIDAGKTNGSVGLSCGLLRPRRSNVTGSAPGEDGPPRQRQLIKQKQSAFLLRRLFALAERR